MNSHHSKGNSFFEEGQYDRALLQYKQAMVVYEYTFPDDDETWKIIDKLRFSCNLNVAASANELGLFSETIQNCYEALKVEPDNTKALYRRAHALRRLDKFEEAKVDITQALKQRPHDVQLREEFVLLKSQIKGYNEKSKAMAGKMIGGKENRGSTNEETTTTPVRTKPKPKSLLSSISNDDYIGADDLDDPVMTNPLEILNVVEQMKNKSDGVATILRPHAQVEQQDLLTHSKPTQKVQHPASKENWVFGDLNRPGAFVRQRTRNKNTGEIQNDCLCCN